MSGRHLPPERLAVATAAFGVMWGVGALPGSALAGQIMAAIGPAGLPASVALAYALIAGLAQRAGPDAAAWRRRAAYPA